MKNLNNKVTYHFLEQWFKNGVPEDYVIRKKIFGKKYGAFEEKEGEEKVYGYYQDNFFSFHIFKENLNISHYFGKVIWPLIVMIFIFILLYGIYENELDSFDTTLKILLGIGIFAMLSLAAISFFWFALMSIASGTTIHYLKKDGTEKIVTDQNSTYLRLPFSS